MNQVLYSNAEPHKTVGDSYWSEVKSTFEILTDDLDWRMVKFKDLYCAFKTKVQIVNVSKPWKEIQFFRTHKDYFTNIERQVSYLAAHSAYRFGQYKRQNTPFIDIPVWNSFNCKFCNGHIDNLMHLLIPNCVVMKQVFLMSKHFFSFVVKKDIQLDQKLILHNIVHIKNSQKCSIEGKRVLLLKSKFAAILKRVIVEEKERCDYYSMFIHVDQRLDFINKLVSKVRNNFMVFFNTLT